MTTHVQSISELAKYMIKLDENISDNTDGALDGFFYIPNFISEGEEDFLIGKITTAPRPKWRELQARRLQYWGGQLSEKQVLIPESLPDFLCKFPPLIERIRNTGAFESSKHKEPNHCKCQLVNEYEPGQGIMPHEDGGAYYPAVATISLGSHTLLDIYRYNDNDANDELGEKKEARSREQDPRFCILQERRSLLITKGAAYKNYLHGIAERHQDDAGHLQKVVNREYLADQELIMLVQQSADDASIVFQRDTRLSMTFRDVEKVAPKGLANMLLKR